MILGIILILIGLLLLFEMLIPTLVINYGLVWPLILLLIGITGTIKEKKLDTLNTILIFLGTWFFLLELDILKPNIIKLFWPLILIIAGITIVVSALNFNKQTKNTANSKIKTTYNGIFGGTTEKISTKAFEHTKIYAIFGGVELDLTEADFKEKETVLNIYSIFGGTDLKLPKNVNVKLNSTAILGGNENNYKGKYNAKNKTLIINCISIFGGTDII